MKIFYNWLNSIHINNLKEDTRKLGLNLLTAGSIALFVTNRMNVTLSGSSVILMVIGIVMIIGGNMNSNSTGEM